MKAIRFSLGVLLPLVMCSADAAISMFASNTGIPVETAICTVVKRGALDLSKPLLPGNPIETIALTPTVCNGQTLLKQDFSDGFRSLLVVGWRVTAISHQVTNLGVGTSGSVELLISAVVTLERNAPVPLNSR
jgi:hypothetical protein